MALGWFKKEFIMTADTLSGKLCAKDVFLFSLKRGETLEGALEDPMDASSVQVGVLNERIRSTIRLGFYLRLCDLFNMGFVLKLILWILFWSTFLNFVFKDKDICPSCGYRKRKKKNINDYTWRNGDTFDSIRDAICPKCDKDLFRVYDL